MENDNLDINQNNELGDIILDKKSNSKNKKIILAVATLAVVLIIVVVVMNKISTSADDTKVQAPVLPPEPQEQSDTQDSIFKPVKVVKNSDDDNLNKIAEKLKKESLLEDKLDVSDDDGVVVIDEPVPTHQENIQNRVKQEPKKASVKKVVKQQHPKKHVAHKRYYIQVGSFSRYEPNKRFLNKITKLGLNYTYKKVTTHGRTLNKVLIGPFKNEKDARAHLPKVRKNVVSGAFLIKA